MNPFITWHTVAYYGIREYSAGGSLAISVVVFCRLAVYRRMPRPTEWLAILLSLELFNYRTLSIHRSIDFILARILEFQPSPLLTSEGWRWVMAGICLLAILVGACVLRLFRLILLPCLKTLAMIGFALVALQGPFDVVSTQGPDLFSPESGFDPSDRSIFYQEILRLVALTPTGILFGVPAVAGLAERLRGAHWNWTEWAGLIVSVLVGLVNTIFVSNIFAGASWGWLAERFLSLAWLLVVCLVSRLILVQFGSVWNRWIGEPSTQRRTSVSVVSEHSNRL